MDTHSAESIDDGLSGRRLHIMKKELGHGQDKSVIVAVAAARPSTCA
jgi:hypothetical protein